MQLIEIFKEGGFIMYPLLAFSIAIWVIAIQKILFLTKFKKENEIDGGLFDKGFTM